MNATSQTSHAVVHRLLFDALVEIRTEGHEQHNKLVFHLADLFHGTTLDLRSAAEGDLTYDEVLRQLGKKAQEIGCGRWFDSAIERAEAAYREPAAEQPR